MSRSHINSTAVNTSIEPKTHKSAQSKWIVLPEISSPNRLIVRAICHMLWLFGEKKTANDWPQVLWHTWAPKKLKTSCFSQLWNVCTICRECKYTWWNGKKKKKKQIAGRTEHRRKCLWYVKALRLQRRSDAVVKSLLDADGFNRHSKGRHTSITLPTPPLPVNTTWSACLDRRLR